MEDDKKRTNLFFWSMLGYFALLGFSILLSSSHKSDKKKYEAKLAQTQQQAIQRAEQRIRFMDRKYGVFPKNATPAYLDYRVRMWAREFGEGERR